MAMNENFCFALPQVIVQYPRVLPEKHLILVSGGRPPEKAWLQAVASGHEVWAVDHGVDICRTCGIRPSLLIGDGDSASPDAWGWGKSLGIPVKEYSPRKDFTDTQLALEKAKADAPLPFVVLTGAFGGRLDHALSAMLSFAASDLPGCMADEREAMFFLHGRDSLALRMSKVPKAISLIPVSDACRGVFLSGTHWPLSDAVLRRDCPYAISNELAEGAAEGMVEISQREGCLGVYAFWESPPISLFFPCR